ncbi:MAG: hypothetical protein PHY12_15545, partial [Eubacteriales bacterium]|nr:hypothetical protein [Eubacteriales bacterium]
FRVKLIAFVCVCVVAIGSVCAAHAAVRKITSSTGGAYSRFTPEGEWEDAGTFALAVASLLSDRFEGFTPSHYGRRFNIAGAYSPENLMSFLCAEEYRVNVGRTQIINAAARKAYHLAHEIFSHREVREQFAAELRDGNVIVAQLNTGLQRSDGKKAYPCVGLVSAGEADVYLVSPIELGIDLSRPYSLESLLDGSAGVSLRKANVIYVADPYVYDPPQLYYSGTQTKRPVEGSYNWALQNERLDLFPQTVYNPAELGYLRDPFDYYVGHDSPET